VEELLGRFLLYPIKGIESFKVTATSLAKPSNVSHKGNWKDNCFTNKRAILSFVSHKGNWKHQLSPHVSQLIPLYPIKGIERFFKITTLLLTIGQVSHKGNWKRCITSILCYCYNIRIP